jgi:hypothetical protein
MVDDAGGGGHDGRCAAHERRTASRLVMGAAVAVSGVRSAPHREA